MIYLAVVFGLYVICSALVTYRMAKAIVTLAEMGRDERKGLENRLIAMTDPVVLTQVDALERREENPVDQEAQISYIDDKAEIALQRSGNGST